MQCQPSVISKAIGPMPVKTTHVIGMREIIRIALMEHTERNMQLTQISKCLNCSRDVAKELMFAFLYNAEDEMLQNHLIRGVSQ